MTELQASRFKIDALLPDTNKKIMSSCNVKEADNDAGDYTNINVLVVSHGNSPDRHNWSFVVLLRHMDKLHAMKEMEAHFFANLTHAQEFRQYLFGNGLCRHDGKVYAGQTMQEMINIKS